MHVQMCVRKYLTVRSKLQNLHPLAASEMFATKAFFELRAVVKIARAWIIFLARKLGCRIAALAVTIVKRAQVEFVFVVCTSVTNAPRVADRAPANRDDIRRFIDTSNSLFVSLTGKLVWAQASMAGAVAPW
jgi:hypothetical protein